MQEPPIFCAKLVSRITSASVRHSCRGVNSNASPLRDRLPSGRRSCCSTKSPPLSTPSWSARFCALCVSSPPRAKCQCLSSPMRLALPPTLPTACSCLMLERSLSKGRRLRCSKIPRIPERGSSCTPFLNADLLAGVAAGAPCQKLFECLSSRPDPDLVARTSPRGIGPLHCACLPPAACALEQCLERGRRSECLCIAVDEAGDLQTER